MSNEDAGMSRPSWITNNINVGNLLTLGTMLVALGVGWSRVDTQVEQLAVQVNTLKDELKSDRVKLEATLRDLPALVYRVTAQEEQLKATNARVDASLGTISARLAEINQSLGALDTKVAVLTQRVESAVPQRRADATRPPG